MSQQPPSPPLFIVSGEKWGTGDAGRPGTFAGVNRGRERMVALDYAAYPTAYDGGRGGGGGDGSGRAKVEYDRAPIPKAYGEEGDASGSAAESVAVVRESRRGPRL